MEPKELTPEQAHDEECIAQMYAVIQGLRPERRRVLAAELSRRLHR